MRGVRVAAAAAAATAAASPAAPCPGCHVVTIGKAPGSCVHNKLAPVPSSPGVYTVNSTKEVEGASVDALIERWLASPKGQSARGLSSAGAHCLWSLVLGAGTVRCPGEDNCAGHLACAPTPLPARRRWLVDQGPSQERPGLASHSSGPPAAPARGWFAPWRWVPWHTCTPNAIVGAV